jgi:hypothetical protein
MVAKQMEASEAHRWPFSLAAHMIAIYGPIGNAWSKETGDLGRESTRSQIARLRPASGGSANLTGQGGVKAPRRLNGFSNALRAWPK